MTQLNKSQGTDNASLSMFSLCEYIEHKKTQYEKLNFFDLLRDEHKSYQQKLFFSKCMSHFIMSFSDLNKYIFRVEPTCDPVQLLINQHSLEDDHHWAWFLEDIKVLGINETASFSSHLKFLWSDDVKESRMLSYKLSHIALGLDPILKLAVIEAIEATGEVLFGLLLPVAYKVESVTGNTLRYFGDHHFERETGHLVNQESDIDYRTFLMSQEQHCQALILIDEVFEMFTDWVASLDRYTTHHYIEEFV